MAKKFQWQGIDWRARRRRVARIRKDASRAMRRPVAGAGDGQGSATAMGQKWLVQKG
jgi:hypothetical protein